ncbi:tetratricopeptide repeat protein [Actinomadura sp. ATCC 31491]|uniref:Tetratricopeptide repeat protein n=1 Tax=Actinomadura luzonensis TaxID=2805427 RepID=A0ABT0FQJ0_9ACTN|nr:tetratricopeptide repeat protein [Actinomadura luzonensis]MCK2214580.1 tetratricopeptide repeat protein [Actinomadura luzonensis]
MLFQEINRLITYDERQRMIPRDRDRLAALLAAARAQAPADHATLRALGVGMLVLGEHEAAIDHLVRAHALADTTRRRIATTLNLADAHRYAGDPATAEPLCRAMLTLARAEAPELVSFTLQHLGKTLTDLNRPGEAREALREALDLRLASGDPDLIAGTRAALRLLDHGP